MPSAYNLDVTSGLFAKLETDNKVFFIKGKFYSKDVDEMVKCRSYDPFFVPELGGKFKLMNGTDKMLIFSFFLY